MVYVITDLLRNPADLFNPNRFRNFDIGVVIGVQGAKHDL